VCIEAIIQESSELETINSLQTCNFQFLCLAKWNDFLVYLQQKIKIQDFLTFFFVNFAID